MYNLAIDCPTYWQIAGAIARDGFSAIPITQPPGHVTLLAIFRMFASEPVAAFKLFNVLCLLIISVLTFFVGRRLFGFQSGAIAAIMVLFSPGFEAYAATLQYEIVASLFLWSAMLAALHASILLALLLLSAGTLVREPLALAAPILFFSSRFSMRHLSLATAAFVVPIGLWIGFQAQDKGQFVPISQKSEINLRVGYNPQANGTYNVDRSGIEEPSGLKFIYLFPKKAFSVSLRKFGYFWGILRDGWNVPHFGTYLIWYSGLGLISYRQAIQISSAGLLLLTVCGILLGLSRPERRHGVLMLAGLLLSSSLFYCCFIGSYRFLVPLLPAAYLLSACALTDIGKWALKRHRQLKVLLIIWIAGLLLIPRPSWELTLQPHELDGTRLQEMAGPPPSIYAPGEPAPRLISYFPPEYLPKGRFQVSVTYHSDVTTQEILAKALLRRPDGMELCSENLMAGLSSLKFDCRLKGPKPIALEVHSRASHDLWIENVHFESIIEEKPAT